jgi:hypothetical protein
MGARVSTPAQGTGKETAVSWVPRASRPGPPGVSTAPAPPEAVGTPAEAAQAVQRFRLAQDVQQAPEAPPAVAGPPAPVHPPQRCSRRRWPLPCSRLHDRQRWRLWTPTRSHGERCPFARTYGPTPRVSLMPLVADCRSMGSLVVPATPAQRLPAALDAAAGSTASGANAGGTPGGGPPTNGPAPAAARCRAPPRSPANCSRPSRSWP